MRFKVGFGVAIRLLIISILEFIDGVKGVNSLGVFDSVLATSLRIQKLMMVPGAEIVTCRV